MAERLTAIGPYSLLDALEVARYDVVEHDNGLIISLSVRQRALHTRRVVDDRNNLKRIVLEVAARVNCRRIKIRSRQSISRVAGAVGASASANVVVGKANRGIYVGKRQASCV